MEEGNREDDGNEQDDTDLNWQKDPFVVQLIIRLCASVLDKDVWVISCASVV